MSEQSETTANTPAQPRLCKAGCGFFGSNATGDMCSKCWRANNPAPQRTEATCPTVIETVTDSKTICSTSSPEKTEKPISMDVEQAKVESSTSMKESPPPSAPAPTKTKKKLKKKNKSSYKSMMAGMLQGSSESRDIEKEKQDLRKVTGGGAFSKIEKI